VYRLSAVTAVMVDILWAQELDDYVTAVAWDATGDHAAAASLSGRVRVIGCTGTPVAELPAHPLGATALAWSPRAPRLAVAGQDGRVRTWEPPGHTQVVWEQPDWIGAVAWSPNGAWLAMGAGRILGVRHGDAETVRTYPRLPSTVTDLAWSFDSRRVGVACYGGPRWFEPGREADAAVAHFDWKGSLLRLVVAPSGKWVAAGNQDRSVHVWRLWSGDDMQMTGYPNKITALAWSPSSRYLAVGSIADVTLWDFAGRGPRGTTPKALTGFEHGTRAVTFSPDGDLLAAATGDGVLVWEHRRGSEPVAVVAPGFAASTVAWRPGSRDLLVGTDTGQLLGARFDGTQGRPADPGTQATA